MVLGSTSTTSAGVPDNSQPENTVFPEAATHVQRQWPSGRWTKKTGGYAYDTSGNGNNLTLAAGATWGLGKVSCCEIRRFR